MPEERSMPQNEFEQPFPLGDPNEAFAQYFVGRSYLAPLVAGSVPVSNVSFEPGCRNNWHIHHGTAGGGDQILMCTAGSGWYQAEGEEPVSMVPGTVIRVPAGTKHWHGAKAMRGSPTSPSSPRARTSTTNGWSRSPTRNTTGCPRTERAHDHIERDPHAGRRRRDPQAGARHLVHRRRHGRPGCA